ncbi:MAG: alpha/beta hydrolase [Chloroflexi bacterium]|nr:alpha/beta hydrolase [Chloroflexota bacterium]
MKSASPTVRALPVPTATRMTTPDARNDMTSGAVRRDVTYCTADGVALMMDLYFPQRTGQLAPVIVFVHGGGWRQGDKRNQPEILSPADLTSRGYLYASLNYRLAPEWKFPAFIQDVKCAIRHLRANAASYNLDPNRIGVIGGSAGGHLVALLGVTDASAGFDVGEYGDQSSRVQAVVDMFGPADLTMTELGEPEIIPQAYGTSNRNDPILVQASPVTYVSKDDPPFLILHGDKDRVVPLSQSQVLYERLRTTGVNSSLVIVKNAGHNFAPAGGIPSPSNLELGKLAIEFFDRQLGKASGGLQQGTVRVGNLDRSYSYYVPANLPRHAPLVLAFHGSGTDGEAMRVAMGNKFASLADRDGFVAVYPDGYKNSWNDCRKTLPLPANVENIDDPGFVRALIARFQTDYGISPSRVFAIGFSNGAQFVYRLALELADEVAAVAAVSANLPTDDISDCRALGKPIPLLIMTGTADPTNPYNGGSAAHGTTVRSAQATAEYFAKLNGQTGTPKTTHQAISGSISVDRTLWNDAGQRAVVLFTINGGAHGVPKSGSFDGPTEIWNFFRSLIAY